MKKFGDFAKEEKVMDGEKIKIEDVLDKEIFVFAYKIKNSQFNKTNSEKYLIMQFKLNGEKHIAFTGSNVLIDQIERYKDELPFSTIIKRVDKYFTFS